MPQCFKCKKDAGSIASRDGPGKMYCKDCFTAFCTRTVRDAIFSQCHLPCEEPVAVAVSGGAQSMLLLHQLGLLRRQGQLRQGTGTTHFILLPFHLCENELVVADTPPHTMSTTDRATLQEASVDMRAHFAALRDHVRRSPAQWTYASTPLFTEDEMHVMQYSDFMSGAQIAALRHHLHHPRLGLSDREELYANVRRLVLCAAARRRVLRWRAAAQQQYVEGENDEGMPSSSSSATWVQLLLGDGAITAGVAAMHGLVTGGAGESAVHFGAGRGYVHNVVLLRPLRTLLPMEVILYNRLNHIVGLYTPALCTGTALRSVRRTLETFLHTMLRQHRTMLFNVLNMVGKLQVQPAMVAVMLRGEVVGTVPRQAAEATSGLVPPQGHVKRRRGAGVVLGRSSHLARDFLRATRAPHLSYTSAAQHVVCCLLCGCPRALGVKDKSQVAATVDEDAMLVGIAAADSLGMRTVRLAGAAASSCASPEAALCFLCHACYELLQGIVRTLSASPDRDEAPCVTRLLSALLTVATAGGEGGMDCR